jgi:hypothetical protein
MCLGSGHIVDPKDDAGLQIGETKFFFIDWTDICFKGSDLINYMFLVLVLNIFQNHRQTSHNYN